MSEGGGFSTPVVAGAEQVDQMSEAMRAPVPPAIKADSPGDWMKKNLFSSVGNTFVTLLFVLFFLAVTRWLSGIILSEERDWTAVWTNMRTLFTFNYPASQYMRIWVSLGSLLFMVGLTASVYAKDVRIRIRPMLTKVVAAGGFLVLFAVISTRFDDSRVIFTLVLGIVVAAIGAGAIAAGKFDADDERSISLLQLTLIFAGAVVAFVWLVPFGRFEFTGGEVVAEFRTTVNRSTQVPWTIMMALLVGGSLLGRALAGAKENSLLRGLVALWWIVGPAFLIFLVLRDPAFDSAHLWSTDIPMGAAFALGGGAVLYALTNEALAHRARAIGAFLFVFALFNWLAALSEVTIPFIGATINFDWYPWASPKPGVDGTSMLQKARLSFLLLSLAALISPNFVGERRTRLRFVGAWVGFMVLFHWLVTAINTPSTLDIVSPPFLGGFTLTLSIAYYVMLLSFPVGMLMALARTSNQPIFRLLATGYIEFVRGIPLITVLFFFANMVNQFLPGRMELSELGAILLGYTMFSGAYMAENIRGGLQSIRRGQFEAADALGLNGVQRTSFIVMPQALRVSIPNLVGQAIATFKETSLIFIIGGFDFLRIANQSIPSQPAFLGQNLPALLFVSVVYWIISYAMSRGSRNLEAKLGVGTR